MVLQRQSGYGKEGNGGCQNLSGHTAGTFFQTRTACPQGKRGPARQVGTWRKREVVGTQRHRDSLTQATTAAHSGPVRGGAAQETHLGAASRRDVFTVEVAR